MSKRIVPGDVDAEQQKLERKVMRDQASTPKSQAIKDDAGRVRVRIGLISTGPNRYGVRVYDTAGAVVYDFTVTP